MLERRNEAVAFRNEMMPNPIPDIQRTNLAHTILLLKAMGINDLLSFDFMDPPPAQTMPPQDYGMDPHGMQPGMYPPGVQAMPPQDPSAPYGQYQQPMYGHSPVTSGGGTPNMAAHTMPRPPAVCRVFESSTRTNISY